MSSVADDSSIADSVSSIGQEEWEKIVQGEGSDAETHSSVSRIPTPQVAGRSLQETVLVFPTPEQQMESSEQDLVQLESSQHRLENERIDSIVSPVEPDNGLQITFAEPKFRPSSQPREVIFSLSDNLDQLPSRLRSEMRNTQRIVQVRMTIGHERLELKRPLKLFYFGDEDFQDALEAKIGSALVAARHDPDIAYKRRKYSVLPVSGDTESPQVELMPDSGTTMEVDTCISAIADSEEAKREISIMFHSGHEIRSRYESCCQNFVCDRQYELPDLAIVTLGYNEAHLHQVCEFLTRHHIPAIFVNSCQTTDKLAITTIATSNQAPHQAVSAHDGFHHSGSSVMQAIDVEIFLGLNSLQLNKNLACLIPKEHRDKARTGWNQSQSYFNSPLLSSLPLSVQFFLWERKIFSKSSLVLLALIHLLVLLSLLFQPWTQQNATGMTSATTSSSAIIETISWTRALEPTNVPSTALATQLTRELIAQPPNIDDRAASAETFDGQLYGDNVVIIRPPKWVTTMKRTPKLAFHVSKNGIPVEYEITSLPEQIFALSIPKKDAYGIIDIDIQVPRGKLPFVTIQVDMGSAWVKSLGWIKAVKGIVPEVATWLDGEAIGIRLHTLVKSIGINDHLMKVSNLPQQLISNSSMIEKLTRYYENTRESCQRSLENTIRSWRATMNETRAEKRASRQARQREWDMLKQDIWHKTQHARQKAQNMAQAAHTQLFGMQQQFTLWRRTHLRNEQKQLFKIWWRVGRRLGPLPIVGRLWNIIFRVQPQLYV